MADDIHDHKKDMEHAMTHGSASYFSPYTGPFGEDVDEAFGGSGDKPAVPVEEAVLREQIVAALKNVYDPEIPLNIYDLGLIYGIVFGDEGKVEVEMTLTAPGCPVAGVLVKQVADAVGSVHGVSTSHVKLVWDPPWTKDRMSEEALLELGLL